MVEFGELVTVNPWQAWPHEEHHFTPWLVEQENLDKLSREVGLPALELEGREMRAGSLRADVIARAVTDKRVVLIENQLGWADFDHLGRTLAYANAFNADIVVWIAGEFAPDHLAAFRWLNEHTKEDVDFFAVQVKVFRIGDSQMAPKFEVLERPNDWVREVRPAHPSGELNELQQYRQDFWEFHNQEYPGDLPRWFPGYRNSNVFINIDGLVVSLYLFSWGQGNYLSWDRSHQDPETRRRHAYVVKGFGEDRKDLTWAYCQNRENWGEMAAWFHDALEKYRKLIAESATAGPESAPETQS